MPVRMVLTSLLCLCTAVALNAQTTRILFIGNSYTNSNNLPNMVRQIGLSAGDTIETSMVAPGGFTLEQHSTNPATQEAIAASGWHHVVIQEQSQRPAFSPGQVAQQVLPYAALLVEQIRAVDPCTEVTFMMTWGRADGDAQNCAVYPPVCTYQGMQQRLRESYLLMAGNNDAWCAPVGQVWKTHREAEPTLDLYTSDGSHPSVRGSYLAATTLFNTLFRRSAYSETVWSPASLNSSDVALIHSLVVNTVLDSLGTWNIGVNDPDAHFVLQQFHRWLGSLVVLGRWNGTGPRQLHAHLSWARHLPGDAQRNGCVRSGKQRGVLAHHFTHGYRGCTEHDLRPMDPGR
jgi:hypothetical protein